MNHLSVVPVAPATESTIARANRLQAEAADVNSLAALEVLSDIIGIAFRAQEVAQLRGLDPKVRAAFNSLASSLSVGHDFVAATMARR